MSRALALLLLSALAGAALPADPPGLAGHYRYVAYTVERPDGHSLKLADLGAIEATLDVSPTTITLHMKMANGQSVDESARVVEWAVGPRGGHWLAQWPDMDYPVKAVIGVSGKGFTSETHFDNPKDPLRYGTTERAVLERE